MQLSQQHLKQQQPKKNSTTLQNFKFAAILVDSFADESIPSLNQIKDGIHPILLVFKLVIAFFFGLFVLFYKPTRLNEKR